MANEYRLTTHCKVPGRIAKCAPMDGNAVAIARLSNNTRNDALARSTANASDRLLLRSTLRGSITEVVTAV